MVNAMHAPGALQHVIGRGINRQAIFSDKADHKDFLYLVGELVEMSPEEIIERG
jgi:hypothetical protein